VRSRQRRNGEISSDYAALKRRRRKRKQRRSSKRKGKEQECPPSQPKKNYLRRKKKERTEVGALMGITLHSEGEGKKPVFGGGPQGRKNLP